MARVRLLDVLFALQVLSSAYFVYLIWRVFKSTLWIWILIVGTVNLVSGAAYYYPPLTTAILSVPADSSLGVILRVTNRAMLIGGIAVVIAAGMYLVYSGRRR